MRPLRDALSLLLLLTAGCAEEPPEGSLRLVDHLDRAAFRDAPSGLARRVVFDSGSAPEGSWLPIVKARGEASAEERDTFRAATEFGPGGSIELGPQRGSWIRVIEHEGPGTLILRAELSIAMDDVDAAVPLVRLGVGQLDSVPATPDVETLAAATLETTWGPLYRGPLERVTVDLEVALLPATRAVAVSLSQRFEPGVAASLVRFERVQLLRPGFEDYAASLAGDPRLAASREPALGRYLVAQETREGWALAPGSELALTATLPRAPARFEAHVGLPHHEDFAVGQSVTFQVALTHASSGRELARWSREVASVAAADARWHRIGGDLPAEGRGEEARFTFSVAGSGPPSSTKALRGLPVFATPTIEVASERRVGPNVVLVSLDTLRADRVGAYGYERSTTPNLDEFARDAWVFEDTWSASSYTLPSHMSLFSGQHPSFHGVQKEGDGVDPKRTALLARLLRERGYRTAAFTGGGYLHPLFGFAPGFESYSTIERVWNHESTRLRNVLEELPGMSVELAESAGLEDVTGWLAAHRNESFFLFFHTYAPHEFDAPASSRAALGLEGPGLSDDHTSLRQLGLTAEQPERPIPADQAARLNDLYDAGVHQADLALGRLLRALRDLDLMDETIVIVTSDHGKEIGDHGQVGHGHTLYEELLQIPLVVRFPGLAPRRVEEPAMLVDIFPTILEQLGIAPPQPVQGRSLFSSDDRALFAEVDAMAVRAAWRRESIKTIFSPLDSGAVFAPTVEFESYDLDKDPAERAPLERAAAREQEVVEHRHELRRLSRSLGGQALGVQASEAVNEQLEALGYTRGEQP